MQERRIHRNATEFGDIADFKGKFGGPDRDRTDDLFHAMEARSQLRHRPTREDVSIVRYGEAFVKLAGTKTRDAVSIASE